MARPDERAADALRPLTIEIWPLRYAEGSARIRCGNTEVLCAVSVEEKVPPFRLASGGGWLTAEYSMLPRATHTRSTREVAKGSVGGRTAEIQRLIGRSLRAVVDLDALGPRTVTVDCDVIQADGGTRTAAITGAYVALELAVGKLLSAGAITKTPLRDAVAAVSVGIVQGEQRLDLCYKEDAAAEVDCNVVMTGGGQLIEVQATAEHGLFTRGTLDGLLDVAGKGIRELLAAQRAAVG